jgi:elongator complex protein 3
MHGCFDAIINFGLPSYNHHKRTKDLNDAKKNLETSEVRLIGVTFETRPDYCTEQYVDQMLEYGATRVEIGVQTTRDDVLKYVSRGNTVQDAKDSIRIAKDAGLKVNAHMMPNLPLSDPATDIEVFRELFSDPGFRPDMMKIYPTLVVEGTKLYGLYQKGEYIPYPQDEIVKVIAQVKSELPPYVRIQRVQRDIPANLIIDGVKHSNLRQLVQEELKKQGKKCRCIRCREEGFYSHQKGAVESKENYDKAELLILEYEASQGTEFFISIENTSVNVLYAFLRLRIPSKYAHRSEISLVKSAIVREIRVVGELVPHGTEPSIFQIQHRGLGKTLMSKAEEIAIQQNCEKILVIAGIGVRPYFYKLGYAPDGPYVSKDIKTN